MKNMQPQAYKHEDSRRILTEWIKDIPIKSCKIVEVKDSALPLGKHYHKNKDEIFYILKGKGVVTLSGKRSFRTWLFPGETIFVPRGVAHTFELEAGTIMLGGATEPFDPNDEIPVE